MITLELTGSEGGFKFERDSYIRDTKLRDMFNKAFGASVVMAWSTKSVFKNKGEVNVGSGGIIILKPDGKCAHIYSSEWCCFEY